MERNITFRINTNNLCLICLKDCEKDSKQESKRLGRILANYFGVDLMVPELVLQLERKGIAVPPSSSDNYKRTRERMQFSICENCSALTNTLNEIFLELELAHIKMKQYGQNLSDIMKYAGKVPCRLSRLNKRMPQGIGRMIVDSVRKQVLQKCSRRRKKELPVPSIEMLPTINVDLNRETPLPENSTPISNSLPFSSISHFTCQQSNNRPDSEEDMLALLGCTLSIWIVLLLALLDVDQIIQNVNENKINVPSIVVPPEPQKIFINQKSENEMPSPPDVKPVLPYHSMHLRKRKIKMENCEDDTKRSKNSMLAFAQSIEEMLEKDISKVEVERFITKERRKWRSQRGSKKYTTYEMQISSLITTEEATNAVKAIQILTPQQSQRKTVHVKEECEVQLCFSGVKEDHFFSSFNKTVQSAVQSDNSQVTIVDVPPVAINFNFVDKLDEENDFQPMTFPITDKPGTGYNCFVCHEHFESCAKI